MKLHLQALADRAVWEKAGFELPKFDLSAVKAHTLVSPTWLHLGAGNIFRAFPAAALQRLLDAGEYDRGLVVAECFDGDIINKAYAPYDNLSVLCVLKADGSVDKRVVASVVEALRCDGQSPEDDQRLMAVLANPSLEMVSMTITEKGYAVKDAAGNALSFIQKDLDAAPAAAATTIGKLTAGLLRRFRENAAPIALVSMDNCSHNGDKLKAAVLFMANGWLEKGQVEAAFLAYLQDESKVSFPISMIDKITPRPDD